MGLTK
jgi:predicted MFS family arabinose efflux permease